MLCYFAETNSTNGFKCPKGHLNFLNMYKYIRQSYHFLWVLEFWHQTYFWIWNFVEMPKHNQSFLTKNQLVVNDIHHPLRLNNSAPFHHKWRHPICCKRDTTSITHWKKDGSVQWSKMHKQVQKKKMWIEISFFGVFWKNFSHLFF